jgi:hypothetical protein
MWTGLAWLKIGAGGELLWIRYWTFGFHEMLGNYRVASWVVLSSILSSCRLDYFFCNPILFAENAYRKYVWFIALFFVSSKNILFCFVGGTNSSEVLDVVEYYSIQSNVWCDLAPLPLAVLGAGAAFLDQKLYVVGGKSRTGFENGVWVSFCRLEICCLVTEKQPHPIYDWNEQKGVLCACYMVEFIIRI